MNNRGWGLNNAFFFIIIVCLSILITMVSYNRNFADLFGGEEESLTYSGIEEKMMHAARSYVNNYYYKALEDGDSDYVTVKSLVDQKILSEPIDPQNKKIICTGYVTFEQDNGNTEFEPYLKCANNYETDGYRAGYDA